MTNQQILEALQAIDALRQAQVSAAHAVRTALGTQLRHWSINDWQQVPELMRDADEIDRAISKILNDLSRLRNSTRGFLGVLRAMEQTSGELADEADQPQKAMPAGVSIARSMQDRKSEAGTTALTLAALARRPDKAQKQAPRVKAAKRTSR